MLPTVRIGCAFKSDVTRNICHQITSQHAHRSVLPNQSACWAPSKHVNIAIGVAWNTASRLSAGPVKKAGFRWPWSDLTATRPDVREIRIFESRLNKSIL
jgi:hypothetical protein